MTMCFWAFVAKKELGSKSSFNIHQEVEVGIVFKVNTNTNHLNTPDTDFRSLLHIVFACPVLKITKILTPALGPAVRDSLRLNALSEIHESNNKTLS
jgi:hypothetical protein